MCVLVGHGINWTCSDGGFESLRYSGPEVIKLFSCSTHMSMNFFPLINVNMPTIVGILTFISRKNSILHLPEPEES